MTGLDTNVLVRFLLRDDPLQSPKASRILASLSAENPGWVGITTIVELVWVLTSKSRLDRAAIVRTIDQLLLQEEITIEQPENVRSALRLYRNGNADFADCLIALSARTAGCARTLTFDRVAARDAGLELIA